MKKTKKQLEDLLTDVLWEASCDFYDNLYKPSTIYKFDDPAIVFDPKKEIFLYESISYCIENKFINMGHPKDFYCDYMTNYGDARYWANKIMQEWNIFNNRKNKNAKD